MTRNRLEYKLSYRRNLFHFQPPGATLFVSARLTGSIPVQVQKNLLAEAKRVEAMLARIADPEEKTQRAYLEHRRLFGQWDATLHATRTGPFWLGEAEVADALAQEMHNEAGRLYDLEAFCIMPNHFHIVYTPLPNDDETYQAMSAIMHTLKGRAAYQANLILGRRGKFWQHENYDHVVRDEDERQRIILYVLHNPVKAGLVQGWRDWAWSYCKYPIE